MNREIKFKCWIPSEKFMGVPFNPFENDNDPDVGHWRDESVFLQWTGLLDKNGKEIYEGDRVNMIYPKGPIKDFIGTVVYDNCEYIVQDKKDWMLLNVHGSIEVIGNIYENPDLLQ